MDDGEAESYSVPYSVQVTMGVVATYAGTFSAIPAMKFVQGLKALNPSSINPLSSGSNPIPSNI